MTEEPASPAPKNTAPGKPILYEVLVLCVLLLAVIVVYSQIFRKSLFPASRTTATLTGTGMASTKTPSETPSDGFSALEPSLTLTPNPELPNLFEPPIATAASAPSLTPAFGSCQYTLREGPVDYLYGIYWNWHINQNIPDIQDYYDRITCAPLLSNIGCEYQAADPDFTKPGWILILPGVSENNCLHYGGKPIP